MKTKSKLIHIGSEQVYSPKDEELLNLNTKEIEFY